MTFDKTETNNDNIKIPLFIRVSLIIVATAINLPILLTDLSLESLGAFAFSMAKNLVLIPGIFLTAGLLLKLRDDTFKLSNAYYLGVVMAIALSSMV
ncbi:MAG: hypothetical protein JKY85_02440 [Porticoccus sp.]|nr:hypothetical protein [Porticoccus sp.]